MRDFKNHDIVDDIAKPGVRYEKRPARRPDGSVAEGLYNAWITLDNPSQYNSYTTDMVKGVILAMRAASNARDVNCVVFTGVGDKAFCTGGNTKEYAEYYAGHPQEYRQYMRLFNDMVIGHPGLRQAGDLPRQRHAHRRRAGDRHGLRLLGRAGPGALRPGRPQARLGADRRRDRLPAGGRGRRARDGRLRAVRAVLGAQGLPDGHPDRHRAGAEGRRQVRRQPAGRDAAPVRRVRPQRLRRAEDRRRAERTARR